MEKDIKIFINDDWARISHSVKTKLHTERNVSSSGLVDISPLLYSLIGEIEGIFQTISIIHCEGSLRISVNIDGYCVDGELTTKNESTKLRLVKRINQIETVLEKINLLVSPLYELNHATLEISMMMEQRIKADAEIAMN